MTVADTKTDGHGIGQRRWGRGGAHRIKGPTTIPAVETSVPLLLPVVGLVLFAVAVGGSASNESAVAAVGVFGFGLIGFGPALSWSLGGRGADVLGLGVALGAAVDVLVGTALLAARGWPASRAAYWLLAVPAAAQLVRMLRSSVAARLPSRRTSRAEIAVLVVTGAGLVAMVASALAVRPLDPAGGGVLVAVSPAWYLGLVVLVAATVSAQRVAVSRAALPSMAAIIGVALTPVLAYALPRYSWTAKQIGLTTYVLVHGGIPTTIGTYHGWPGLFAGVSWLCRTAGYSGVLAVAHWWPVVIDSGVALATQRLGARASGREELGWLAAVLMFFANTIGQDYYSPQSVGLLLAIAVFAVAYRPPGGARMDPGALGAFGLLFAAMTVSHPLSPYMTVAALAVLAILGFLRAWWMPVAAAVVAIGWTARSWQLIRSYVSIAQIGRLSNLETRGELRRYDPRELIHVSAYAMATAAVLVGVAALVVLVRNRSRRELALLLCAASSGGLVIANSYGNEGVLRVVLFAVPWLAVLAAEVVRPTGRRAVAAWTIGVVALAGAYLVGNMGLDVINVMRPGDLAVMRTFELRAPTGSQVFTISRGYVPAKSTARFARVRELIYPDIMLGRPPDGPLPANSYETFIRTVAASHARHIYVMMGSQAAAEMFEVNLASMAEYWSFERALAHSGDWRVVDRADQAVLFQLRAGVLKGKG